MLGGSSRLPSLLGGASTARSIVGAWRKPSASAREVGGGASGRYSRDRESRSASAASFTSTSASARPNAYAHCTVTPNRRYSESGQEARSSHDTSLLLDPTTASEPSPVA